MPVSYTHLDVYKRQTHNSVAESDLGTPRRQFMARPVKVQEDDPPRRSAEVVDPSDGLLPSVTPLVQMHGSPQPVHLCLLYTSRCV